ncbi:MAG: phage major capsid protein [Nitrososphaerota archaeon]
MAQTPYSIEEQTGLFLTLFKNRSANMYNSANVLEGRIKKTNDFVGKQMNIETQLSFAGGYGAKLLPQGNPSLVEQAIITAKKHYSRVFVDREGLKAASTSKGAFQTYLGFPVKKTVEDFMRNMSRIMFSDGSGVLGRGDGATNVTGNGSIATPYIVTLRASDFNAAFLEEKSIVQVVTGLNAGDNLGGAAEGGDATTNLLTIVEVNEALRQVKLVGTSPVLAALVAGPSPLGDTSGLVPQRSYLAEAQGLKGALMATSGSLYGIPVQRRWSAFQEDAQGAGVVIDALNHVMLSVEKRCGESPNAIICNYNQYRKLLAQMEDQKRYNLPNKNVKGHMGFSGIEYMGSSGSVGIFVDRFCDEDKIYFLNDKYIHRYHRPGGAEWFQDDKTVFLRTADEDVLEARYGSYMENFITPTFHGVLHNLAK